MRNCRRTSSYSREEDLHLCRVYLDISRCPIRGPESKGQLWCLIDSEYNSTKPKSITHRRPKRSLCARMRVILAAVDKLKLCIQQVEDLHLNNASEQEILFRAKSLLIKDENFKKGFRFDHVWPLLKDVEKYGNEINTNGVALSQGQNGHNAISHSDSPVSEEDKASSSSRSTSHGLSSSSHNENEENPKRENVEGTRLVEAIREENRKLAEMITKDYEDRQRATLIQAENESKKLAMAEYREDNKILLKDLNSITDLNLWEMFVNEQKRILQKRSLDYLAGQKK